MTAPAKVQEGAAGVDTVGHGFGTAPVFLASLSTIMGAILYLRFGYAVAHAGLMGTLLIIILGHLVTIPTALAIAEIATNRRVEGGGAYFIISRSFGTTIGGAIGIALYLSQAISVAFYMIAFAEAFHAVGPWLASVAGITYQTRFVSVPATVVLGVLVAMRGAAIGVKALWGVFVIIAISLVLFWLGSPLETGSTATLRLFDRVENPDSLIFVFAIVFPAFTGMAAGVGLSGDLANPRKSIPQGVIWATVVGMLIYTAVAVKLALSATPDTLASDDLIMTRIAVWGPIIPIGLACAAISSAIGSILVAPRTLQALGTDRIIPIDRLNAFLAAGVGRANEPRNATAVTAAIALVTVAMGGIDMVARIISMFFMVTYGALCAISGLEHFAARPSYRPSFRSKWYLSLIGFLMCVFLMFQMDPFYAFVSVVIMVVLYRWIRANRDTDDIAAIFQGVLTQATRYSQVKLQKSARDRSDEWRPSIIMVNGRTFDRTAHLQMLSWLCHRYGVGTYIHFIPGRLDPERFHESRALRQRLIDVIHSRRSAIYVDTMISPSMRSALAQALQLPGVSGVENNVILFEFTEHDPPDVLSELREGCLTAAATRINSLVLRHGEHFFGARSQLHIWLTWHDYQNANLMILLAYILLGHPDWHHAEIRIFAAFPQAEVKEQRARLNEMIASGRLPISRKNLRIIPTTDRVDFDRLVETRSSTADLVILGFTAERLTEKGPELFKKHLKLRDVLFVSAQQKVMIE